MSPHTEVLGSAQSLLFVDNHLLSIESLKETATLQREQKSD
jgi:hypothetical protein